MRKLFISLGVALFFLITSTFVYGEDKQRPFWTEKSAFVEGDVLYAVGVASNVKSPEKGRELAFNYGKTEIMNFAQIANIDGIGITIETQMTYEEINKDGTLNVYRLLKTNLNNLLSAQKSLLTTAHQRIKELDEIVNKNRFLMEELLTKKNYLNKSREDLDRIKLEIVSFTKKGDEVINKLEKERISALKQQDKILNKLDDVREKAEYKQAEIEKIFKDIQDKVKSRSAFISKIEKKKEEYDVQDKKIDALFRQIYDRIQKKSLLVKKYVKKGMTRTDVLQLLGQPASVEFCSGEWLYGNMTIHFTAHNCSHKTARADTPGLVKHIRP